MRVVFCCGRFNPPTLGHLGLIEAAEDEAGSDGTVRIFTTESHDKRRNPLSPSMKLDFLSRAFPTHRIEICASPFDAARKLAEEGFEEVTFVVGQDRARIAGDFERYGSDIGFRIARTRKVPRPPEAISATQARAAAVAGDFDAFARMVPTGPEGASSLVDEMYRAIRSGSGV